MASAAGRLIIVAAWVFSVVPSWAGPSLGSRPELAPRALRLEAWKATAHLEARPSGWVSLPGCSAEAPIDRRFMRGLFLADSWHGACAMRLKGAGPTLFSAGALVELQEDPSAFHLLAGAPIPDRVSVPGFLLGRGVSPLSLGVGAWTASPRFWAVAAITLAF